MTPETLVERFNRGDPQVFPEILKACERIMYSVAHRHFPRDSETAEDVMQEARLKLWHALPRLKEESSLHSYAYSITTNVANDFHRAKNHKPVEVSLDHAYAGDTALVEGEEQVEWCSAPLNRDQYSPDPVEMLEMHDTWSQMMGSLELLSETTRLVFVLKRVEGVGFKNIAEKLQLSHSAVLARYQRAVKKIKVENQWKI